MSHLRQGPVMVFQHLATKFRMAGLIDVWNANVATPFRMFIT